MSRPDPLQLAAALLGSLEALRNWRALLTLLGTFSLAGLLLSMLNQAAGEARTASSVIYALLAGLTAFYGGNAAGLMLMDDARGLPVRPIGAALRDAVRAAHRLLGALLWLAAAYAAGLLLVVALLALCRLPLLGPPLYALVMPLSVVVVGLALLAVPTVLVPLAAPAVWAGAGARQCVVRLYAIARRRLLSVAVVMLLVGMLAGMVGAMTMFVAASGGRVVGALSLWVLGIDAPVEGLMGGLFGRGLRTQGAAGLPAPAGGHWSAGLIGGGMVFVVGVVLPGLIYLRGACAVYLVQAPPEARSPGEK